MLECKRNLVVYEDLNTSRGTYMEAQMFLEGYEVVLGVY